MDNIRLEHKDEYDKDKDAYHRALDVKYCSEYLNRLGENGWEILLYDRDWYCYLLKREKRD